MTGRTEEGTTAPVTSLFVRAGQVAGMPATRVIAAETPIVPGEIRPLNQTSSTPAKPAMMPAKNQAKTLCAVTSKPIARMRLGLSRIACSVSPKVERAP